MDGNRTSDIFLVHGRPGRIEEAFGCVVMIVIGHDPSTAVGWRIPQAVAISHSGLTNQQSTSFPTLAATPSLVLTTGPVYLQASGPAQVHSFVRSLRVCLQLMWCLPTCAFFKTRVALPVSRCNSQHALLNASLCTFQILFRFIFVGDANVQKGGKKRTLMWEEKSIKIIKSTNI